ncbi:MAG TPA: NAD(P)-dependent oxidoreductase [Abditibacteriaceae bacterium]|jgi:phosphoglycerate dehydrogenase-like enzyme
MNILINLPPGFFQQPELTPIWERLARLGTLRQTSHNAADEIRDDLAWADALFMWSWPALSDDLLNNAANLKFRGHIDISQGAARVALSRDVPLSLSRGGFSPAVSEIALALILSTLRKVSDYHAQMRASAEPWVKNFPTDIDPLERELTGRSVGLVGFGNVGRRLGELLQPFRPELRVYDPFVPGDVLQAHNATRVELDEMLRDSDVVVLCAASNPGTAHLIGRKEIELLRPHAVFINVARAALVDTQALVERLQRGDLFAAIDVFDSEPLERDAVLRTLPNAYLTPHRAGGTMASVARTLNWLIDDFEAVLAGKEQKHALVERMLPSLDA